jgi:hypothetical protein
MKSLLISLLLLASCTKLNGTATVVNKSGEVLKIIEVKTNTDKFIFKNVKPNETKNFKFDFKENGEYEVAVTRSNNTTFEKSVGFYKYGMKSNDELIVTDSDVLIENQ